ncbi:DUF2244 domain-containing protein [Spiribacter pallidus]|uniref:DUF2244 domain-containing protein n=1 Tax=Spiribacter pallidus TaxID=1987936 RepID=UPI0034A00C47
MSTTQSNSAEGARRFVLAPNIAPNWGQTVRVFIGLSVVCLGVALVLTSMGFWPVLPFAGLELTALGAALYVSARRSLDREIVHVEGAEIRVEKGRGRVEKTWYLDRAWTEVALRQLPRRWEHTQLVLRSRGREVILGEFLETDERRSLARELSHCIGPMARCGTGAYSALTGANDPAKAIGPTHSLGERTG